MSPKAVNGERRKQLRKDPPSLVYVELGPSNGGMLRNLSEEGFSLRAMMPLRPGDTTPFSFSLNQTVRIEGQGEILWIEEDGRVVGVRFLELPAVAQAQIVSWLNGALDSQEKEEQVRKPLVPEAQTFEELREEIRASIPSRPPTKPHWDLHVPAAPLEVPVQPIIVPEKLPEEVAVATNEAAEQVEPEPQETAHVPDATAFPGLPNFSSTQQAIEISFEPLSPPFSRHVAFHPLTPTEETAREEIRGEEEAAPPSPPGLPDISEILMPPPSHEAAVPSRARGLATTQSSDHSHSPSAASWMERFTLSRAVAIMVLLGLSVGVLAYHRTLGQALIWLGEKMGGTSVDQVPVPTVAERVTSGEAKAPVTSSTAAPASSSNSMQTQTGQENSSPPESNRNDVQTPPSTTTQNSLPVTPLSGGASSLGSEAGLAEYSQALQLLHERSGGVDTSEALRLLWISVEKGNPSAELTLAELYWHGKGVARNCDQARILLSAAARKGNAEAQKQLRQFERDGCE